MKAVFNVMEMIMSNPIMVNRSGLTNRIYAGRAKPAKNFAFGAMKFVGEKFDVTDQVLHATAHYLAKTDDIKVFTLPDGREIHLRADIKDKQETDS